MANSKTIDLTGKKFGHLTVLCKVDYMSRVKLRAIWFCQCSCGKYKEVYSSNLRKGRSRSCGCRGKKGNDHDQAR